MLNDPGLTSLRTAGKVVIQRQRGVLLVNHRALRSRVMRPTRRGSGMNPKHLLGVLAVLGPLAVLVTACGSSDSSSSRTASTTALTSKQLDAIPPIVRLACSKDQGLKDKTIGVSWS